MRKWVTIFSLVVALIGGVAFEAGAIPITGQISFSGTNKTNASDPYDLTTATAFTELFAYVVSANGNFGAIPLPPSFTVVDFHAFVFDPPALSVTPLWDLTLGSVTYSFNAGGVVIDAWTKSTISLGGPGTAYITGFDPTPGTWSILASGAGTWFGFAASSNVAPVPEPSTLFLMGSGLLGLWGFRKKFKK